MSLLDNAPSRTQVNEERNRLKAQNKVLTVLCRLHGTAPLPFELPSLANIEDAIAANDAELAGLTLFRRGLPKEVAE